MRLKLVSVIPCLLATMWSLSLKILKTLVAVKLTLPKGYYVVSDPVEAIKKKQFNEPIRKVLYDLLKPENFGKIFNYFLQFKVSF